MTPHLLLFLFILPLTDSLLEELSPGIRDRTGRRVSLREVRMKRSTNMISHSEFLITREFLI